MVQPSTLKTVDLLNKEQHKMSEKHQCWAGSSVVRHLAQHIQGPGLDPQEHTTTKTKFSTFSTLIYFFCLCIRAWCTYRGKCARISFLVPPRGLWGPKQVIRYGSRYFHSFGYIIGSSSDILLLSKILFQPLWSCNQ